MEVEHLKDIPKNFIYRVYTGTVPKGVVPDYVYIQKELKVRLSYVKVRELPLDNPKRYGILEI